MSDHDPDTPAGLSEEDLTLAQRQLGRPLRGGVDVAYRCPCGGPAVVRTLPRLPDGTPFPTSYYATCPRLTGAISTLESEGMMVELSERIASDEEYRAAYERAHQDYLARRSELGEVLEIDGISAGGMPTRVKCLHVVAAHSLAVGRGVNLPGDETVDRLPTWWTANPCCGGAADERE